jgi:hypothetical protein
MARQQRRAVAKSVEKFPEKGIVQTPKVEPVAEKNEITINETKTQDITQTTTTPEPEIKKDIPEEKIVETKTQDITQTTTTPKPEIKKDIPEEKIVETKTSNITQSEKTNSSQSNFIFDSDEQEDSYVVKPLPKSKPVIKNIPKPNSEYFENVNRNARKVLKKFAQDEVLIIFADKPVR